jgi:hypothetical protein
MGAAAKAEKCLKRFGEGKREVGAKSREALTGRVALSLPHDWVRLLPPAGGRRFKGRGVAVSRYSMPHFISSPRAPFVL